MQEKGVLLHQKLWQKFQTVMKEKEWEQKWKQDIKEIAKEERKELLKEIWNTRKNPIKIRSLDLAMQVGTGDAILTSYAVAILSTLTSIALTVWGKEKWRKDYQFAFLPNYQDKLFYSINISTTVQIRIWELLHILWLALRWKKSKAKAKKEPVLVN